MVTKLNMKEVGWMYHSPPLKQVKEEVPYPPASQIPMLGVQEELPPMEPKEMIFKDTDTPYIMLAKQNGRQDLLRFREWCPENHKDTRKKVSNQGAARCDWFYLEDNALEDAENKRAQEESQGAYAFTLPDYMVHRPFNPSNLPQKELYSHHAGKPPRRTAPFATWDSAEVSDDQLGAKGDNRRPFGYGVRQEKFRAADEKKRGGHKDVSQLPAAGADPKQSKHPDGSSQNNSKTEEALNMSKILAHSYANEKTKPNPRTSQNKSSAAGTRNSAAKRSSPSKPAAPVRG